ncbi:SDR family oxidoreductase [Rhizobiaceae bacterium BDR2-2]|uniref:SDR family oxidoreductase n=1 Tax=Ectorhizobium quercum TaxID=2965071 RepID=A0AAE3SVK8_9HYPH|nr:SDR family oxidoreductase [Ectorhizobium quercum]MCX8997089.1 SDR family oxidoreductase [Ectorhizobium quercum]
MTKGALITGGGTGIGRATAEKLAAAGYAVTCFGLEKDEDLPAGIAFVRGDVTSKNDIDAVLDGMPTVAAIVNCAGILRHGREWQTDDFEQVIRVNLTAALTLCTAALPKLEESRGAIVNIASMWSFFGSKLSPAYAASKMGVVALTRSMAVNWGAKGIRANAVAPGWIDTNMAAKAKADPERSVRINERIALARWGTAEEVASVIAFLCSPEASYVTGSLITVDGGYSIG